MAFKSTKIKAPLKTLTRVDNEKGQWKHIEHQKHEQCKKSIRHVISSKIFVCSIVIEVEAFHSIPMYIIKCCRCENVK